MKKVLTILFLFLSLHVAQSQIGVPGGGNIDDESSPAAPVDGFVGLGLVAGVYIGLRKKLKRNKPQ